MNIPVDIPLSLRPLPPPSPLIVVQQLSIPATTRFILQHSVPVDVDPTDEFVDPPPPPHTHIHIYRHTPTFPTYCHNGAFLRGRYWPYGWIRLPPFLLFLTPPPSLPPTHSSPLTIILHHAVPVDVDPADKFVDLLVGEALAQIGHDVAHLGHADEAVTLAVKHAERFPHFVLPVTLRVQEFRHDDHQVS